MGFHGVFFFLPTIHAHFRLNATGPSGVPETIICEEGACANQVFNGASVVCDDNDDQGTTCSSAEFSDGFVACRDKACFAAKFEDSQVDCYSTISGSSARSCGEGSFRRSTVSCTDDACYSADVFSASAVTCDSVYDCKRVLDCSCCDGDGCPVGSPSCTGDLNAFCSSKSTGRTCKEWGNPVCKDISVGEYSIACRTQSVFF